MIKTLSLLKVVLIFTFLIGGIIQYLGLLSNTIATIALSGFFLLILIFSKARSSISVDIWPFFTLIFIILFSSLFNGSKGVLFGLYAWTFAIVPFTIWGFFAKQVIGKIGLTWIFNFFVLIGLVQLPVLIVQQLFAEQMVILSARPLAIEDVAFGTFFFANDHGMSFFILSMIIYLLFDKEGAKRKKRWFLVFWFSVTIVVANSNISFLLLLLVLGSYILPKLNIKTFLLVLLLPLILVSIILVTPVLSDLVISKYEFVERKLFEQDNSWDEVQRKIERGMPERSDIILYYQRQEFKVLGDGPYTYFDPIQGKFVLFKNFSQYLWFYNDIGAIGVICILLIYLNFYLKNGSLASYRALYLILVIVYALFTNTLSDLAFNIILAIFILKDSTQRIQNRNYERSMYSIPRLA